MNSFSSAKKTRYDSQSHNKEDQRYQRARRQLVPQIQVGEQKSIFCNKCDETYYFSGKLGEIEWLNRHQSHFKCVQFRRERLEKADREMRSVRIFLPRKKAVAGEDTELVFDGIRRQ